MQGFSGRIVTQKNLNGVIDKPKTVVDSDYKLLENKPSIEGVTLSGNKSLEDFGLVFDSRTIVKENGVLKVADGSHEHTAENIEGLQEALEAAENHAANEDNPHNVTKSQLGLGNVENKSSAAIRGELTKSDVTSALGYTPPTTNTTYGAVTQSANGLMSAADKKKLDGIAAGAQANTITGVKGGAESSYRIGQVNITAANIGLGNVENKSSATIRGELTKDNVTAALGYTPSSESGAAETVTSTIRRQLRPSELFRIF